MDTFRSITGALDMVSNKLIFKEKETTCMFLKRYKEHNFSPLNCKGIKGFMFQLGQNILEVN